MNLGRVQGQVQPCIRIFCFASEGMGLDFENNGAIIWQTLCPRNVTCFLQPLITYMNGYVSGMISQIYIVEFLFYGKLNRRLYEKIFRG